MTIYYVEVTTMRDYTQVDSMYYDEDKAETRKSEIEDLPRVFMVQVKYMEVTE